MDRKTIIQELNKRMETATGSLDHNLKGLRTNRATPSFLDHVLVEAYGSRMPISQLATVNAPESRLLTVQVWDASMTKAVEKGIVNANLGVTPIAEGQVIRVPLPQLSEERRKELIKIAHEYGEQAKISSRNIRRDSMEEVKKLEKAKAISEDEMHTINDDIQKVVDQFSKKIDEMVKLKEQEISHV